jgi:predicted patatin/cPLA2 family phospholipase
MEQKRSCLVLEGGALRGVYTSGVQGVLYRNQMQFDCLVGTSAGAMNGANFLSGQPERSYFIDYHYARDKNFMGLRPLIREGQVFSFQYMFSSVNEKYPINMDAFYASPIRFIAVATDYETGDPVFLEQTNCSDMMKALQASSSMPLLSTPVELDGKLLFDGGPSMAVGFRKALDEGYERIVLVLTRHKGYRKSPFSSVARLAMKRKFRKYPNFINMMESSYLRYNQMMDEIDELEEAGTLFVIRPTEPVTVSRMEKNLQKLEDFFHEGRANAEAKLSELRQYLSLEEV